MRDELCLRCFTVLPQQYLMLYASFLLPGVDALIQEAHRGSESDPLYVLMWGTMCILRDALFKDPSIVIKVRAFSIATYRKAPHDKVGCNQRNYNDAMWGLSTSGCRQPIYDHFPSLWWVESDWTYNGVFLKDDASKYGDTVDMKWKLKTYGGK